MPADLKAPFKESCCDGGECGVNSRSAQPCGCDAGIGWFCIRHRGYDEFTMKSGGDKVAVANDWVQKGIEQVVRSNKFQNNPLDIPKTEVRVVDPKTGGEKGAKLARFSLIPSEFLWALAEHYGKGSQKYADRNWEKGYKWSLTVDALQRHLHAWLQGESIDPETGSNHLIAVAWHACALFIFELRGIGTNDVRVKG